MPEETIFQSNEQNVFYKVIREIGRGGHSVVYEVEKIRTQGGAEVSEGRFALKQLHANGISDVDELSKLVDTFLRQRELWPRIQHPNIVGCVELIEGDLSTNPYMVMELLEGETLRARLKREGALSPVQVIPILEDLLSGLEHAHSHNAVHKDLKPENLMLTPGGVKILDYGLGKQYRPSTATVNLTIIPTTVGLSIDHAAPEQFGFSRRNFTPATDRYTIGVILYQMLTGHIPKRGVDLGGDSMLHVVPEGENLYGFEEIIKGVFKGENQRISLQEIRQKLQQIGRQYTQPAQPAVPDQRAQSFSREEVDRTAREFLETARSRQTQAVSPTITTPGISEKVVGYARANDVDSFYRLVTDTIIHASDAGVSFQTRDPRVARNSYLATAAREGFTAGLLALTEESVLSSIRAAYNLAGNQAIPFIPITIDDLLNLDFGPRDEIHRIIEHFNYQRITQLGEQAVQPQTILSGVDHANLNCLMNYFFPNRTAERAQQTVTTTINEQEHPIQTFNGDEELEDLIDLIASVSPLCTNLRGIRREATNLIGYIEQGEADQFARTLSACDVSYRQSLTHWALRQAVIRDFSEGIEALSNTDLRTSIEVEAARNIFKYLLEGRQPDNVDFGTLGFNGLAGLETRRVQYYQQIYQQIHPQPTALATRQQSQSLERRLVPEGQSEEWKRIINLTPLEGNYAEINRLRLNLNEWVGLASGFIFCGGIIGTILSSVVTYANTGAFFAGFVTAGIGSGINYVICTHIRNKKINKFNENYRRLMQEMTPQDGSTTGVAWYYPNCLPLSLSASNTLKKVREEYGKKFAQVLANDYAIKNIKQGNAEEAVGIALFEPSCLETVMYSLIEKGAWRHAKDLALSEQYKEIFEGRKNKQKKEAMQTFAAQRMESAAKDKLRNAGEQEIMDFFAAYLALGLADQCMYGIRGNDEVYPVTPTQLYSVISNERRSASDSRAEVISLGLGALVSEYPAFQTNALPRHQRVQDLYQAMQRRELPAGVNQPAVAGVNQETLQIEEEEVGASTR